VRKNRLLERLLYRGWILGKRNLAMTEKKLDPATIFSHTVNNYETKDAGQFFCVDPEAFRRYVVEIEIKGSDEVYYLTGYRLYKGIHGYNRGRETKSDELEEKKDSLGKVTVVKDRRKIAEFESFDGFREAIRWE
jgi:hypothetical protein